MLTVNFNQSSALHIIMVNTDLQFGQQRSPGASYSCIKHSSNKSRGGGGAQ